MDAVIAFLADKATPTREWTAAAAAFLGLAITNAAREDRFRARRILELANSVPHLLSARAEKQPRRASALAALREVERQAAKLSDALDAAILDPWLNVNMAAEILRAEMLKLAAEFRAEKATSTQPGARTHTGNTILADTRESLEEGLFRVAVIRHVAQRGIGLLQSKQLRGRPSEAGARIPAVMLSAVVRHQVPAPHRGAVEVWRGDLANFISEVLLETGLMKRVSLDFIESTLR